MLDYQKNPANTFNKSG